MAITSEEAIAKAEALVASRKLDVGPAIACIHVTRAHIESLMRDADPSDPAYELGIRLAATTRDCWAINFEKNLPEGVVECPSTVTILVFDDTGEASEYA